jgi:tRNA-binding EMAP/Myf-like protein
MNHVDRRLNHLDRIAALGEALGTGSITPITGRLEYDKDAVVAMVLNDILVSAKVTGGKSAGMFLSASGLKSLLPSDFVAISAALYFRAWDLWERLWVGKHPDRADESQTGEDFDLMPVWRAKVRDLFAKHHMAHVLDMDPQAYMDKLMAEGLDQDFAVLFTETFFDVHWEPDPAQ